MTTTAQSLTDDYLRRLESAARRLPRRDREELVAEIRDHVTAGVSPESTEADVRNLLDELGLPEEIVAAAAPQSRGLPRRGAREVFALILLVTGLPPVLGWLVGVGLLLWSPLWSGRQKLLGILVWPGGYVVALGAVGLTASGGGSCASPGQVPSDALDCTTSGPSALSIIAVAVLVVAPLVVAAYLYRAANRPGDGS